MSLDHTAPVADAAHAALRASISAAISGWSDETGIPLADAIAEQLAEDGLTPPPAIEVESNPIRTYVDERPRDHIVLPVERLLTMPQKWQAGIVEYLRKFDAKDGNDTLFAVAELREVALLALTVDERDANGFEPADDGLHFIRDGALYMPEDIVAVPVTPNDDSPDIGDQDQPDDGPITEVIIEHTRAVMAPTSPLDSAATTEAPVVPPQLVNDVEDAIGRVDLADPEGEENPDPLSTPTVLDRPSFDSILSGAPTISDEVGLYPTHHEAISEGIAAAERRQAEPVVTVDQDALRALGLIEQPGALPSGSLVTVNVNERGGEPAPSAEPHGRVSAPESDIRGVVDASEAVDEDVPTELEPAGSEPMGFSMPTPPTPPAMPDFAAQPEEPKRGGLWARLRRD